MKTIIVTGAAGFIGSKVSEMLLQQGHTVIGIDNLNDYYDIRIKYWRLEQIKNRQGFVFCKEDIENLEAMRLIFRQHQPDAVINLAARAGVRYSMENPHIYMSTNAQGTLNLLELCRKWGTQICPGLNLISYAGQEMPLTKNYR